MTDFATLQIRVTRLADRIESAETRFARLLPRQPQRVRPFLRLPTRTSLYVTRRVRPWARLTRNSRSGSLVLGFGLFHFAVAQTIRPGRPTPVWKVTYSTDTVRFKDA